jgi:hypothetical protein
MMVNRYKKRKRNLYGRQNGTFPISRSKIDLFVECPRCFYLDRKIGLGRPSMPGWSLNSAVDELLKKEFDIYRERGEPHPLMVEYGIDAIPYRHKELNIWRDDVHHYIGASVLDNKSGLEVRGIVDDVWINPQDELLIVDYKSTSSRSEISLDDKWKQGYKRQMEIYQWIFRKLGYPVASIGYFVFANGIKDNETFDSRLEFEMMILSHEGDDSWIGPTMQTIRQVLDGETLPESGEDCEYCEYRRLMGVEEN